MNIVKKLSSIKYIHLLTLLFTSMKNPEWKIMNKRELRRRNKGKARRVGVEMEIEKGRETE